MNIPNVETSETKATCEESSVTDSEVGTTKTVCEDAVKPVAVSTHELSDASDSGTAELTPSVAIEEPSAEVETNVIDREVSAPQVPDVIVQEVAVQEVIVQEVAVQEVAVQEVAVQEVAVQEVAVQEVAVQEVAVQEVAVQEVAVQEVAVQEVAVQEVAVQEVAVQEVAVQEVPVQEVAVQEVPVQEVAVQEVAVQEVAVQEVAVQEVAVQEVAVQEVAVQEVAVQEVPVQEVAVQEVAVQEVPVQEVAVQEVPVQEVPVQEVPVQEVPVQEVPVQEVPVQEVPVQEVPLQEVPVQEVPVQEVPLQEVPVQEVPLQEVPVQEVPLQEVPVQEVPVQEVPVQEVPLQEVPVQEVPLQEVPVQEVPVQEVPVQEVPVQEVPVQEVAVQEVAVQEVAVQEVVQEVAPAEQEGDSKQPASSPQSGQPTFADFSLLPQVKQAVESEGYVVPTEIQAEAIPVILDGRDVIGQANTGTGKTAAFALPLLCRIAPQVRAPQVVVLAPTRELALQVAEAFETYAQNLPEVRVATIYGGQSYGIQIGQLKRGSHIVVGTPGRVIDHMRRGNLKLDHLKAFVLDEADEMLNMGFAEDVSWILSEAPSERQTLMFSATVPHKLRRIADSHLNNPVNLALTTKTLTTKTVHQRACMVPPREKLRLLSRVLESEKTDGVIVFVKTKDMSGRLAENLCQRGFKASALNGDMAQNQRERTVDRLKSGQLDILVATDVAARGLDVDRITHVINYDYPTENEAYVHRIGRTGRAGREGHAILFVGPRERHQLKHLEKVTGQKVTWMLQPTNEEIRTQRGTALQKALKSELEKGELEDFEAVVQQFLSENPDCTAEQVAAGLARMIMQRRDVEGDARDGSKPQRERRGRNDRRDSRGGDDRRGGDRFARGKRGERSDRRGGGRFEGSRDEGGRGEGGRGRFERDGRGGKPDRRPRERATEAGMVKYRIEVGYSHGVKPGNIVGALTSESGLRGSEIGGIDINTHFSTVDLPAGLPPELLQGLGQLRVAGQPLKIREWKIRGGGGRGNGKFDEKPRNFSRRKNGKPSWKKSGKKSAK